MNFTTRDFINVGIFSALYFVVVFAIGMVGFFGPAFMFIGWTLSILINGAVIALYATRVPKVGALALLGLINAVLFIATGHWWGIAVVMVLIGLAADLIKNKNFPLAYAIFTLWFISPLVPAIVNADTYYAELTEQMGAEYADQMRELFTNWVVGIWFIMLFILGYAGGLLGKKLNARNFQRAGLA
ncbi:MptD family putative ECF transporter S component [Corynebacterium sp. TAE3-ERU12]|uniref:MptD family putative ECF transporter S component n=1 Tax=Corynebacterium sp. TAE3-ERU12 TaxID=2849491 RepID=UPI001C4521B3|nr:MptD family putative ECF transporter S component [Corynebacterium sp. TAE3-ERU12]